jgi:hypothetical protein
MSLPSQPDTAVSAAALGAAAGCPAPMHPDTPLTSDELARILKISTRTPEAWRQRGVGPRYYNHVCFAGILSWAKLQMCNALAGAAAALLAGPAKKFETERILSASQSRSNRRRRRSTMGATDVEASSCWASSSWVCRQREHRGMARIIRQGSGTPAPRRW